MAGTSESKEREMKGAVKVDRSVTDHHVGTLPDGSTVRVTIGITTEEHVRRTTEHDEIDGFVRLSVTGSIHADDDEPWASGQIRSYLLGVLEDDGRLADGWSVNDVLSLWAIWKRWHLNDMRAGCAHMDSRRASTLPGRDPFAVECSAGTGYTYGSSWLVDVIPPKVVAEVLRLQALPGGVRL